MVPFVVRVFRETLNMPHKQIVEELSIGTACNGIDVQCIRDVHELRPEFYEEARGLMYKWPVNSHLWMQKP